MTFTGDQLKAKLQTAQQKHDATVAIRREMIAERCRQLKYEDTAEHEVGMHMQDLTGSVSALCKKAGDSVEGFALVQRDLLDIELSYSRLAMLISALRAKRVS